MFIHSPIDLIEYQTVNIDNKRFYVTPNGKYPSITTIMGSLSKESIDKWKKSVGEETANKISRIACSRGTNMHLMCEEYLNNQKLTCKIPDALELFYSLKPELNKINNILGQEKVLYSDKLKVAGRVDCIADYDGISSIIDFKTSKKIKSEEDIQSYFLQTTFYALALAELKNIVVKQVVILMATDNEKPQIFIKPISPYIKPLIKVIKNFHKE
jgi:genome maintenance exonuclease 1